MLLFLGFVEEPDLLVAGKIVGGRAIWLVFGCGGCHGGCVWNLLAGVGGDVWRDPCQCWADVADESQDPAAIALGNIVGSNIFNIGAILGITALVKPLPIRTARRDFPLMLAALVALTLFLFYWSACRHRALGSTDFGRGSCHIPGTRCARRGRRRGRAHRRPNEVGRAIGLVTLGLVMLVVGGDIALKGAVALATEMGMSTRRAAPVMANWYVAAGTSDVITGR